MHLVVNRPAGTANVLTARADPKAISRRQAVRVDERKPLWQRSRRACIMAFGARGLAFEDSCDRFMIAFRFVSSMLAARSFA